MVYQIFDRFHFHLYSNSLIQGILSRIQSVITIEMYVYHFVVAGTIFIITGSDYEIIIVSIDALS